MSDPEPDRVVSALEGRARDLSMAIDRPEVLAKKLRESLVDLVGPEKAVAYYIGAELKDGAIQYQVARLGPRFLTRFSGTGNRAELQVAYQHTSEGGWKIAVGVSASTSSLGRPRGSSVTGGFSIVVSR